MAEEKPARSNKSDFSKNIKPTYEIRDHLGYMPADPIQKNINEFPPIGDMSIVKKQMNSNTKQENADKMSIHKKELNTKEARNLKEIIGDPVSGN